MIQELTKMLIGIGGHNRRRAFHWPLVFSQSTLDQLDELCFSSAVSTEKHDAVPWKNPLLPRFVEQSTVRCFYRHILQCHQRFGMGAAVCQLDVTGAAVLVRRFGRGLNFRRPLVELLCLGHQKIRAGVDTDVLQLHSLSAQLLGLVQIIRKAPLVSCVSVIECCAGRCERQRKHARAFRTQENSSIGRGIQKCPIMRGDHNRHIAWQARQPVLQHPDAMQVQMVGWLIQQ